MSIDHQKDQKRFVTDTEHGEAVLGYQMEAEGVVNLSHTRVPKESEGQGIGSALAQAALEWAKAEELEVVPGCPFVRAYIDDHPEYGDLLQKN